MTDPSDIELEPELDALYQAPLKEFVSVRNDLVRRLSRAGAHDASAHVKALAKPSASAWAVNQLYWNHRSIFDAVVRAGDQHRDALADGDADAAEHARRAAVDDAQQKVAKLLAESGQKATDVLMRRVATTLDAVASYGSGNPNPVRGRLTTDLDPPGFSAFGVLRPKAPRRSEEDAPPAPPVPVDTVAEREAELEKAKAELSSANARVASLEKELSSLQARILGAMGTAQAAAIRVAEKEALLERARADAEST